MNPRHTSLWIPAISKKSHSCQKESNGYNALHHAIHNYNQSQRCTIDIFLIGCFILLLMSTLACGILQPRLPEIARPLLVCMPTPLAWLVKVNFDNAWHRLQAISKIYVPILALSNEWRETKLFDPLTSTETKPWLSGDMLPNIYVCKNGWLNVSENLRIVALKFLELTQFASPNQSSYFNFCTVLGVRWDVHILKLTSRA